MKETNKKKNQRLEIVEEDEAITLKFDLGPHERSPHLLDLDSISTAAFQSRDEQVKDFWTGAVKPPRPGRMKRFIANLRGVFENEREHRLLAPGKPRLLADLFDELLICNLFEIIFIGARAVFTAYFSALVFCAGLLRREDKIQPEASRLAKAESFGKARVPVFLTKVPLLPGLSSRVVPLARKDLSFLRFSPPVRFERALVSFVLLAFVFILPLRVASTYGEVNRTKSVLLQKSVAAFESLNKSWSQVGNLEAAAAAFEDASEGFDAVLKDIEETHQILQKAASVLPEGEQLDAGKSLLLAGSLVAASAEVLAGRLAALNDSALPPAERVHQLGESLNTALPLLQNAREKLDSISVEVIPAEYRNGAAAAMALLDQVIEGVESSEAATSVLEYILGRTEPRRFLVVFQNNAELRPTGGFIGSFAEIDFAAGDITRMWMPGGGSYELQGGLRATVIPPEPLQLIASRWEFQDANWFPDFPSSARKLMWFYEKSGGPTVDGVIALTTSVVQKLLQVTGPIEMPEYGKIITADNFWLETQKAVELEYDKEENRPKQFLADLAPKLIARLKSNDPKTFFALAKALAETIGEKHFQIYLRDQSAQEKITHLGWGGEWRPTSGDSLAIVNTNVAGGKTDGIISEHIKHSAKVDEDGSTVVTVEVTRAHQGVKNELFRGVRNVDYVRIYVPEGSTLLESSGWRKPVQSLFNIIDENANPDTDLISADAGSAEEPATGTKISHEFGRTVFGNWIMVDPGETVTYKLAYRLPQKITFSQAENGFLEKIGLREKDIPQASYSLLLLKQAGTVNTTFEHSVELPADWQVIWRNAPEAGKSLPLDRDRFFGVVATPAHGL
ncbi:DUF4012 domain-containing protein [Candidatus Uhrbacteria bacterium]|nr:DUF4012 domain-containing protein [Candidatus Uhrbacteria bacterium]